MTSFRSILAIPPSTATTRDSVLLLVDIQNEYAHGKLQIHNFVTSATASAQLLERYRAAGGDIIHIHHHTSPDAPVFTVGTELAEPWKGVAPKEGEKVIKKPAPISFTGTNLEELINATGKKKLVVVGYMAHVCISGTVRVAFEKGYDVIVPSDCVGDRHIPGADAETLVKVALAEMADAFSTVVESKDIV
ncbi:isochorismatase hydrolase [Sphaerosporella brunnea]|uniref:Isochorismatase hydrolase n=1 Tax=Sphaerosporella brunnea TaxID=1250544 RepID=A0A5J5FC46_9PEZI|nr:isochorismatase hydrolase [Sphaerosporella brunnea]